MIINNALTRGNKSEIAFWSLLDYDNFITPGMAMNTNYTVPFDGVLTIGFGGGNFYSSLRVNDVKVFPQLGNSSSGKMLFYFYFQTGDIVKITNDQSSVYTESFLIPLKG